MPTEQKRRRDARHAKQLVDAGKTQRVQILQTEAAALFKSVDLKLDTAFGVTKLSFLQLDSLLEAPTVVSWTRQISILDYATWRGRDNVVLQLLKAGADPTVGQVPRRRWKVFPYRYAVWLARAAGRMRQLAIMRPGTCSCGAGASLRFAPCGHTCCDRCVWSPFCTDAVDCEGEVPQLTCCTCGAAFADPLMDCDRKGLKRKLEVVEHPENWVCATCACLNQHHHSICLNCGCKVSMERASVPSPSSTAKSLEFRQPCLCLPFIWRCGGSQMEPRWFRRLRETHQRRGRRQESLRLWRQLPDAPSRAKVPSTDRFRAQSAEQCAAAAIGFTKLQRSAHLHRSAQCGDTRRLAALLDSGADVDCANEYGQSPLFLASWLGYPDAVRTLLRWGADPRKASNSGFSPVEAACVSGHTAVLQVLTDEGLHAEPKHHTYDYVRSGWQVTSLSPDACFFDGVFSEEFLQVLENMWRRLPVMARDDGRAAREEAHASSSMAMATRLADRSKQGEAPRRSYFCDESGFVREVLRSALSIVNSQCSVAYAHMRFLNYAEVGGYLAAHTDLARTDRMGMNSTHTFLLYLSGGEGGETVLLESLSLTSTVTVKPVRGRFLMYPHSQWHRANPVASPKLLLRGELR